MCSTRMAGDLMKVPNQQVGKMAVLWDGYYELMLEQVRNRSIGESTTHTQCTIDEDRIQFDEPAGLF